MAEKYHRPDLGRAVFEIRTRLFMMNKQDFSNKILGIHQSNLQRIEAGEQRLSIELADRIRKKAAEYGHPWNNEWLFSGVPIYAAPPPEAQFR